MYDSLTPSLLLRSLDLALIIPAVTVEFKLKGLPTANTHSPILVASEFPKNMYGSFLSVSILRTAISVSGSVPIIVALKDLLSFVVISISLLFSITWLFVII